MSVNVPIIGSIPLIGPVINWFADMGVLGVNAVVNTGKTAIHAVGEGFDMASLFAKWGAIIGAGAGAYKASQEGKDMLSGALEGGGKGLIAGAIGGAGVGIAKGTVEGGIPTLQQVGDDARTVASGLFPAQETPNAKPQTPQNKGVA
jgi:hypothetical protein